MKQRSRRKFLTDLGLTVGALTLAGEVVNALPPFTQQKEGARRVRPKPVTIQTDAIDFRYAPNFWQSTYCFPDDPYKSLVGKNGELLYGHPGIGAELDFFPQIVTVGVRDAGEPKFVDQKLESPGIPIITTTLEFNGILVTLTSFATNHGDEGRVDNLLIQVRPKEKPEVDCIPEIVINSKNDFWLKTEDDRGRVHFDSESGKLFLAVGSPLNAEGAAPLRRYGLRRGISTQAKPLEYFLRFPQAGQPLDKIEDRLSVDAIPDLLDEVRKFWQGINPGNAKVIWNLPDDYGKFHAACVRNMLQSREIKDGKRVYQVGPTVYRGFWFIDGTFLIEAARYSGFDKEAQECLEWMWDRQQSDGSFAGGAGEAHWKDTAAPVYALVREAELKQNWDHFRELYPDAVKAMVHLKDLRDKAVNDGTANGKYKLLPRGYGDSGLGGIRSELTNTLWALIALRHLNDVAKRLFLPRRDEISIFYDDLRLNFRNAIREEMRKHPNGFSYLPMLMKDDPQWSEPDVRKQPRPQAAQIYLSQAIYPGLVASGDVGHVELMQAVTQEDIPIETGWMKEEAVWTYNGAVV
ncbi:MAG TPA: hypothetical protein VGR15_05500, partial [Bacteroidota bacterium]|nr:hypothetical protein [Bacteroidota bacterium]